MLDGLRNYFSRSVSISSKSVASIFGISTDSIDVTPTSAMCNTTVYACVNVKAQGLSSVPFTFYKKTDNGREQAKDHPLFKILGRQPNPLMTSTTWREMISQDLDLRGTHYSQVVRDVGGRIVAIYPLIHDNMSITISVNKKNIPVIKYEYTPIEGDVKKFSSEKILRIVGLPSSNGITGVTPITQNASSIGLGIQTEQFGKKFFESGANGSGILSSDKTFSSEEARKRLADQFGAKYSGLANSKKPIVLEDGMKWQAITISNNDSQFLETRAFQKGEISSIFRVSPHLINDLSNATFSNITELSLEHVKYCLMPQAVKIESSIWSQLLTDEEQKTYYAEFNFNGLMRGDFKTRTDGYKNAINAGWMKPNEAREMENLTTDKDVGNKLIVNNANASLEEVEKKSLNEQTTDTQTPQEDDNNEET